MNEIDLTQFISAWGWQILAMLFITQMFVMIAIPRNLFSVVFFFAFFAIFVFCEWMSLKRRNDFYNAETISK